MSLQLIFNDISSLLPGFASGGLTGLGICLKQNNSNIKILAGNIIYGGMLGVIGNGVIAIFLPQYTNTLVMVAVGSAMAVFGGDNITYVLKRLIDEKIFKKQTNSPPD